eukprot:g10179.t1
MQTLKLSKPITVEENLGSSDCENSLSEFAFACNNFDYGSPETGDLIALENLTANITVVKESARTLKKKLNEDEDQFQKMFVEADEKRVGSLSVIAEVLLIFGGILLLGFLLRKSCGLEIRKRLRRKQDFVEVYGQVRPSGTPRLQPSESSHHDVEMINLPLETDVVSLGIEDVSQDEESEDPSSDDDEDMRLLLDNMENTHAVGSSNITQSEDMVRAELSTSENDINGGDYSDCTDSSDEDEKEEDFGHSDAGSNDGLTMISDFLLELKEE